MNFELLCENEITHFRSTFILVFLVTLWEGLSHTPLLPNLHYIPEGDNEAHKECAH